MAFSREKSNMEWGNSLFSILLGIHNEKKRVKIKMPCRKFWEEVLEPMTLSAILGES